MANRVLKAKMIRDRQRSRNQKAPDCRVIKITSRSQHECLHSLGWCEVGYQEVDKLKSSLAWFVYPNGMKRLNVLTH